MTEHSEHVMKVVLYTREDCKLCDQAHQDLESLHENFSHRLVEVDIDSDPALHKKYLESIPVVEVGPYTLKAPFTLQDLQITLAAARDGRYEIPRPPQAKRDVAVRLNRFLLFFTRHWLAFFNIFVFLYVGLPFSAPLLMNAGVTTPATWIYKIYAPLCHQLAYRSWFLFGEQPVYPADAAGLSYSSFEEVTGLDPDELRAARNFIGNDVVGYKVGLCQRDVAIYGGIFIAGIVFGLVRKRLKPLPILVWTLVGIVPIAIDGGTQLLSSLSIIPFPARESTPFLRTLTGLLFGVMNIWLAYPYVEESMIETQALVSSKLASADYNQQEFKQNPF